MAYATVQDLDGPLDYVPANAQVLLDRASRQIDRAIQSAVYAVNTDGYPTDAAVAEALKTATCEQVAFNLEVGNKNGIPHDLQSGVPSGTSAGEIGLSRGGSVGGATGDLPWLSDQAAQILRQAGLIGQAPQTYTWARYP